MARGRSCSGRRKSPASCATASQPTKSQTRMFAAVPIAQTPWGANGVQLRPPRDGNATASASASTTTRTDESASWNPDETRRPEHVGDDDDREHREADGRRNRRPGAREVGDVVAADHGHGGRAEQHRGEEPAARDRGRVFAETLAHIGRDAAGDRMAHAERGERDGERRRQDEQRGPGDDRGGAGRLRRKRGHEQEPRPDQRAHVEGRSARDPELPHRSENAAAPPKHPTALQARTVP